MLALFDEEEGIDEVFCEQHEDILLKYKSGKFLGVQIKTKSDGSVPVKARDHEVSNSLKRFIEIEKHFPEYFDGFLLASNTGFWRLRKNGSNLHHLLEEAKEGDLDAMPKIVRDFLKTICPESKPTGVNAVSRRPKRSGQANDSNFRNPTAQAPTPTPAESYEMNLGRALRVLKKLRIELSPPLANMEQPLLEALSNCPAVGNRLYSDLRRIANILIAEVLRASSLEHDSCKVRYFAVCRNPAQAQIESLIAAKRFNRGRVDEVLRQGISNEPRRAGTVPFSVDQLPDGTRIQQAKMTAGGIVIDDVEEAVQQRQAAEYVLSTWLNKYGYPKANAKYQDVRSAVLTECNEAKKQAACAGGQFGPAMLELVKKRIRTLHDNEGSSLHELRYDQLLGIAGVLTEECRLWWSEKFEMSEGSGS